MCVLFELKFQDDSAGRSTWDVFCAQYTLRSMDGTPACPYASTIIRGCTGDRTSAFAPARQRENMWIVLPLSIMFLQVLNVVP
jgi:hypothetical protein